MIKDKRIVIIFLTVFIDLVGFGIIIPMNPYLAKTFGASPLEVGLLMSVYSLAQFIFSPFWGQLSDRIGRRPVILWSLLGASAAHLGFAFAGSFWALIAARTLAGVFGGNISTAMAYIADITSEKDRSKGMGLIGAAFGLGFILGPALGGLFAVVGSKMGDLPPLGQSFPAVIASAICFINFLFAIKYLPESLTKSTRQHGHRFQRIARAFTQPTLAILLFLLFLNTFGLAHVEATLFLYVQQKFAWSQAQASYGFAYIGVIMVLTQGYLIRKFMPRFGERKILIAGLALSAVGFGYSAIADTVGQLALGVTALGLGNGMATPSITGSVSLASPSDQQGNNLGVGQSLSALARILGPPTGGAIFQHIGTNTPFMAAAAVSTLGLLITLFVKSRLPEGGRQ